MRILYFGSSTFAIPPLRALLACGHDIAAVVTQPDRPAGRGARLTPPPVKEAAERLGLLVLQPESCRAPEFLTTARALAPALTVVAAYGQFLPEALLTLPGLGSVNLHPSLLPRYRGAAPIQRAIMAGETHTGVCLLWMAREMDAGDVIAGIETPIAAADTGGSVSERLSELAAALLLSWLPAIADGTAPRLPQDAARATFAPALRKEERAIDWSRPAETIWRTVRALAPAPGAVAVFRGQPLKILAASPIATPAPAGIPGDVVEINPHVGPRVATGDGWLDLLALHPAGKRPISGADFLRGYRVAVGERFAGQRSAGGADNE